MAPSRTLLVLTGSALSLLAGCAGETPPVLPPVVAAKVVVAPPALQALPLVHVQVLALNDFHGNLEPPQGHDGTVVQEGGARIPAGGAVYLAAHVRRLAAENPNTVVVSAGDLTGASPLVSNLFEDEPTILVMNRLGLDFEGVGNHDFDRGLGELRRLGRGGLAQGASSRPGSANEPAFSGARFQYLAANVLGVDGKPVLPPYGVKELGGVKVAFIGMTLQGTRTVTTKQAVEGLTFENEAKTANALLPELRAQGVATTVILLHEGGFQGPGGSFDSCKGLSGDIMPVLEQLDPAFRVVVTAHTHQAYNCNIGGRLVTSAGSYGRLVTDIDLAIDPSKRELVQATAHNVAVTRDIAPDPVVATILAEYEGRARPITDKVIGYQRGSFTRDPKTAHSPSCETPLGDLIADSQLAATRNAGAVLALMNPGGIRTDLVAQGPDTASQPILYGTAFEVEPFANRLITLTLTGAQLHAVLERQFGGERARVLSVSKGFAYAYAYDAAARSATVPPASMRLAGKVIDPAKRYRVTVNSFLAQGGDGFTVLRDAPERTEGMLDIEAFAGNITRESSIAKPLAPPARLERVVGNACE